MKMELLRDRTVDWMDRIFDSPYLEYVCCAVIAFAIAYFGGRCLIILAR